LDLPTYTNIWRIEKRLYKLYDFRLPMPIPVGQIAVFAAISVPYIVILKVVGLPFSHTLLWLYILPPGALAWLVTRPVLEGKRLPELVVSQLRYLGEPRTWCRMAPLAEKDVVTVVARVWRRPDRAVAGPELVAASPSAAAAVGVSGLAPVELATPGPQIAAPKPLAPERPARERLAPERPARERLAPDQLAPDQPAPERPAPERPALERHLPVEPIPAWPEAPAPAASVAPPAVRSRRSRRQAARTLPAAFTSPAATSPVTPTPATSPATPARPAPAANAPMARPPVSPATSARPGPATSPAPAASGSSAPPAPLVAPAAPPARPPAAPPVPRPVVTVTGDQPGERPVRMVERALGNPSDRRTAGWHDHVVVVPGGHRPGQPDQLQRDRSRARLAIPGAHRVVVLGCTVGAGQTMTTLLTGEVLTSLRDEQIAVLDLNSGRGSLAERAQAVPALTGSALPAPSRLEVMTRDTAAGDEEEDLTSVFELLSARYPLILADPGPAAVPRVLAAADQLILVAPASQDAASALASTREWLEAHGHVELADGAITVLNGVSRHTMAHVEQAEALARGRCRAIVRVPWDDHLKRPGPPASAAAAQHPAGSLSPAALLAYTALAGVLVAALATAPESLRGRS
jgi:hypothetical protein